MNRQDETTSNDFRNFTFPQQQRGRRWVKAGVAVALLGALTVTGISFANNGGDNPGCRGHFGMGMHGHMDPASMSKHVDGMVDHILSDGTAEQKAKVGTIIKAALTDLEPLHTQHQAAHQEILKLLSQPTIDRTALEKVRTSEMQLADQASKRITQAVADAADVLTPEQRVKLIDHLKKRMG